MVAAAAEEILEVSAIGLYSVVGQARFDGQIVQKVPYGRA
jgi:hypothetical protein